MIILKRIFLLIVLFSALGAGSQSNQTALRQEENPNDPCSYIMGNCIVVKEGP